MDQKYLQGTLQRLAEVAAQLSSNTAPEYDDLDRFFWTCRSAAGQLYGSGFSRVSSAPQIFLPISSMDPNPFYANTLRRLCLYASPVVFVHSSVIHMEGPSYPEPGDPHRHKHPRELLDLAIEIAKQGDFVSAGRSVVLPSSISYLFDSVWESQLSEDVAPLLQFKWQLQSLLMLGGGFSADTSSFVYKQILLPYFPSVDLKDLRKIASQESEAFTIFSGFIREKLADMTEVDSDARMEELFAEIDEEVARLHLEAKKLSRLKVLRDSEEAVFAVSLVALIATGTEMGQNLAGIFGPLSLLDILRNHIDIQRGRLDLRKSQFYLPLVLQDARTPQPRWGYEITQY